jgi:hypothetical protein
VSICVGVLRGGSVRILAHLKLRSWPLVLAALGAQVVAAFGGNAFSSPRSVYVAGMVVSAVLVTVFVVRNRWLAGMPLVALGFVLNAVVITANGGMPVSIHAADDAGVVVDEANFSKDQKHILLTDDTVLPYLADVIPLPTPGGLGANVLSVGDLVLATGIGILVCNGMLRPGPGRRARQLARGRVSEL